MDKKPVKSPFVGQGQPPDPRFTENEIELLKKLNEETLKVFRSVFYQDELTKEQLEKLKGILSPDLVKTLRKFFIYDLDWNEPIFGMPIGMPTRWQNPKYDALLTAEIPAVVGGRQMAIRFLERGLERLWEISAGGQGEIKSKEFDIRLKDELRGTDKDIKTKVVAAQDAFSFLETGLQAIYLYTLPEEKLDEIKKKMLKDSSR